MFYTLSVAGAFVFGAFMSWLTRSTPLPEVRRLGKPRRGMVIEFPRRAHD